MVIPMALPVGTPLTTAALTLTVPSVTMTPVTVPLTCLLSGEPAEASILECFQGGADITLESHIHLNSTSFEAGEGPLSQPPAHDRVNRTGAEEIQGAAGPMYVVFPTVPDRLHLPRL
jgi:hypothetical protein